MRKSAEVRREEILAVAVEHFAEGGYFGTSTEAIAKVAGISQPYLFRLFRTKRELFVACTDRACAKVLDAFRRAAAEAEPGEELHAMGQAYVRELLPDRHAILMLMQGYAAVSDAEIQAHVRRSYADVVTEVTALSGGRQPDEIWTFFATGMLLNIYAALDLEQSDHPVFRAWTALHA
jgi:AcrR family transcriptional regulator